MYSHCTTGGWVLDNEIDGTPGPGSAAIATETATDLYRKLEETILPLYYTDTAGWRAMMKQSIGNIASYFSTHRMMRRYATEAYLR